MSPLNGGCCTLFGKALKDEFLEAPAAIADIQVASCVIGDDMDVG
jgi:hypothetical protein